MPMLNDLAASALTDLLFEEPGLGRCLVAPDRTVLRANADWLRSNGTTLDDVLGADLLELFPDTRDLVLSVHDRARAGHRVALPRHARRIRGRDTWWEGSVAPVPMEGGTGLLITEREVTGPAPQDDAERKGALEGLVESEAALDAFFAGSPGILNLTDDQVRYLKTDATTPTYFGLTRETIIGRSVAELAPGFMDEFGRMMRRVIETGEPQLNLDVHSPVPGRPGEITHWRASYFPVPLRGGRRGMGVMGIDITDVRKAEAALRDAHERLRIHVETTPLGLVEWDSEYRVTRFTRRAEQMFGWSAEEIVGRRIDQIPWIPEEDWPSVRSVMRDMSDGARPASVNANRNLRKDGSVIHCEWYNSTVRDDAGRLVSVLSLVLDVTVQKRAEDAVRQEEKKYRSLFENSLDAVYLAGQDGTILDANRAACRMHGMTLQEIKQRGRAGLVVNDERHAAALKARAATGQVRAEMTDLRKDGSRFPVEVESVIVDPTRPDGPAFVIARDISERKRAEETLRQSEERLRALADSMPQLAWTAQPDGEVTWFNRRWYEYTGATPARMEGWGWQSAHDPETLPEVLRRWKESLATGAEFEMEFPLRAGDGTFRRFLTRIVPLKDRDGQVLQWFGTHTDVTELIRAQEALREADRRKTEFLGVLSHELRNPLAPIRNGIYLLERAPHDSEQAVRARAVIRRQTEHLTHLVDDLLDITRISRGKIALQRSRVDVRDVVRKTTDDLRSVFAQADVELHVGHVLGPVWIEADRVRIAQVIGNLLQNTVKFTPRGGTVTVALGTSGKFAEIRVRDTGIGLEPETIEHMFEPFAQADNTLARTTGGLGLGLALVRGLVELHGGSVQGRSEGIGHGAEFLVRLPLAESQTRPDDERATAPGARARVVLVIEDNVDAGRSLADILELHGHCVSVARDGRSGLELARELQPDFVLCDIGLPDLDGYEIARALRRDDALRATRLVAVSGYSQPEDRQRAREAGFDAHLAKPPDVDELMTLLADDG